jgi:hypothetical protein
MIISNQYFNANVQNRYSQTNSLNNLHSQNENVNRAEKVLLFDNVEISKPAKSAVIYMGTEGSLVENLLIQTRLLNFAEKGGQTMEVSHRAFNNGEAMELSKSDADDLLNGFYSVKEVVSRYVLDNLVSKEVAEEIKDLPLEELDINSLIDDNVGLAKIKENLLKDLTELKELHPELAKLAEETFDKIINIIDKKMIDKESDKEAKMILSNTGDDEGSIRDAIEEIHQEIVNNPTFTKFDKKIKRAIIEKLQEALAQIATKKEEEQKAKELEIKEQEIKNQNSKKIDTEEIKNNLTE